MVGSLKCNFDAAFDLYSGQVHGGWILCDCNGDTTLWGSGGLRDAISSFESETKVLIKQCK